MNRDIPESRLIDYLYGESDEASRREIEAWLEESPEARAQLKALQSARAILREYQDEPAGIPPVFVEERVRPRWVPRVVTVRRAALTVMAAAAAAVMMFANVEFGVRDGGVHFSAGWRTNDPGTDPAPKEQLLTVEEYLAVQQRYFELTRQMIEASEVRQEARLARFAQNVDAQRTDDLRRINRTVADVGVMAEQGYRQSGVLIRQLAGEMKAN